MSELQSTIEFSVELYKFYNVDLFQRGMYQIRCSLRVSSKLGVDVEVATPEVTAGLGSAIVLGNYGACRPFQILYRNEEVSLKDVVLFRCHMLVDGNNLRESLERAEFSLVLDLWFSDSSPANMLIFHIGMLFHDGVASVFILENCSNLEVSVLVSSRTLQLNMSPIEGLHYHLPVLFDYFHLSAISVTIHASLTALHQPSMKKGILRYMQSCAPKTSKSWSKIRSTHCSSLTDPVLPMSSHKVYSKINESPQVHLEVYNVLLDSSNNLKTTIKEYKLLLMQREEIVSENYDTLVVKHNEYDSTKLLKKPFVPTSSLAELCAENIKLWNYFLLTFSCKIAIQQFLSRKHHNLRVRRFAELFFLVYNPRKSAMGCYETSYHNYFVIAELAKRSKYMHLLPPLPVHCTALDGESATMPVIFEDQYQDPFEYQKRNCEEYSSLTLHDSFNFKRSKTVDNTNCSCGMENVWIKAPEKPLMDLVTWQNALNTVPARHSKSLDHLLMCSTNHHLKTSKQGCNGTSTTIRSNKEDKSKSNNIFKIETLKNVSSDHNMQKYKKYFLDSSRDNETINDEFCNCHLRNYNSLNIDRKSRNRKTVDNFGDKKFYIKNLGSEQQYNAMIKSVSHSASIESIQNIIRSSSAILTPNIPNKVINKSNSLFAKCNQTNKSKKSNVFNVVESKSNGVASHSKTENSKNAESLSCSSKSSSTETFSIDIIDTTTTTRSDNKTKTLLSITSADIGNVRKVRSASCIVQDLSALPLNLTVAESLPDITAKLEERLSYPTRMKYYSSSSSTSETTEQSGWMSSRSSSPDSSTDVTNPATSAIVSKNIGGLLNISEKKYSVKKSSNYSKEKRLQLEKNQSILFKKSNKSNNRFNLENISNGTAATTSNGLFITKIPTSKGCEYNQPSIICDEDIALPPPKQFRDLESPSSSISTSNGTPVEEKVAEESTEDQDEEEINAVDNLLYHVVDMQTTLEREPSQFDLKSGSLATENGEFAFSKEKPSESLRAFLKAQKNFKSQLNFAGIFYSDLNNFASTVPYFHISDEFRIFSPEGMHLVVCVHGLDGNSADLRLVKTYLELGLPGANLDFLMSERNQGDTFSDFETMTDRLVSEILHYLDSSSIRPTRVSFVGHSLGNIIIRSALTRPQMKFLLPRLQTFLSLSGPHLGTLYNSSGLVNMGMWFMQKWKKSGSLLQLCLKDSADPRKCFLYRLSQRSTLHHFKNILLCGSGQDRYVPLHSARIELCKESLKDTSDQGAIYREMVHNIISPIIAQKEVKLLRYDVHHVLPNTANALIGRAAHIAVLDSEIFIEKFMVVVGIKYFR